MHLPNVAPLVIETRGPIVESVHYGALVVVNVHNEIIYSLGNADVVTYLRSSAKPFQVLPFVERGGMEHFNLDERELAIMCGSHYGTDEHVQVVAGIQQKIGVTAGDLLCGMHPAPDPATAERMIRNNEEDSPLRHNCSGKHTGMLAFCRLSGLPTADYTNPAHPVQMAIIKTFSDLSGVPVKDIVLGIDGCSVPVFAVPLRRAAWAFAQLADPSCLPEPRKSAIWQIIKAMTNHPDMVAGPGSFDTILMQVGAGKIISKAGAEGYQALALLPGACGKDSPAYGITIKISDGDRTSRARTTAAVAVLRHLGALDENQIEALREFTTRPVLNWQNLEVGEIRAIFTGE